MTQNILKHESDVWKTADLLIGAGIKQSDFPKYMMPFFALLMVESRLIRESKRLEKEMGKDNIEDFIEMFRLEGLGYNDYVIRQNKTLKVICKNDKTFDVDFVAYLKAFDIQTRNLLGVDKGTDEEKYLDISGVAGLLKKKDILFDTVKAWSEIDLALYNNSEITTLEEHIKRKWADISAETAGEQYTPDDIIALISEIIASNIEDNGKYLTIYDPTCGGGNLLFGVEDRIKESFKRPIKTHGNEWNDALFALAKIESRFRTDSDIQYGNTLTKLSFIEKRFDVVVANPPYGVDWKGYQKDIKNDTTERFVALPSISDGQYLFTQHILYHLANDGISVVVHNGSTLFSGDAGSGESTIRKHFFDNDWVEAIIQMPTDEFFNTGIYTYLWIFNKNKSAERKDKIILIDASSQWEMLKKSKGKKRHQMNKQHRAEIVEAFTNFNDNDFAKVFDKWHFYYNKQAIMLTNVDENGKAIVMPVKTNKAGEEVEAKSIKLNPTKITFQTATELVEDMVTEPVEDMVTEPVEDMVTEPVEVTDFEITTFDADKYQSLLEYFEAELKPTISNIDYKESKLKVFTAKADYWFDDDKNTIVKQKNHAAPVEDMVTEPVEDMATAPVEVGCGKIVVKTAYKKATKTKEAYIAITVELTKDLEKDYEIIPYSPDEADNQQSIADFMAKYVTRPFEYLENTVGVELNFNKIFYIPEQLREITEIQADLNKLENELNTLENELKF